MISNIPDKVNLISDLVAERTKPFVRTKWGKLFLGLVLFGPFTFIPTLYMAWTAPNIDSLRTLTWPLITLVNISGCLGVIHNGSWQLRLVMVVWVFVMFAVCVAIFVR